MEFIVAKPQADSASIAVIGTEPELASEGSEIAGEDQINSIAVAAYYKAEARGYEPGHEMQDWLDAEAESM